MTQVIESIAPDWSTISHDVLCPLCEYNLRGTRDPRCPECGYRYEWSEVVNPKRALHPYLFEHHPERNIRSWWRTLVGAWLPRRFFKSLHPTQPSRPERLIIWWVIGVLPLALAFASAAGAMLAYEMWSRISMNNSLIRYGLRASSPRGWDYATLSYAINSGNFDWTLRRYVVPLTIVMPLAWPIITFASLLIFQISMHRAKIKLTHVLRCVLYSFDLVFMSLVVLAAALGLALWLIGAVSKQLYTHDEGELLHWAAGLIVLIGSYRLYIAYKYYLRFYHPLATVVSTQVITLLTVCLVDVIMGTRVMYHVLDRLFGML